ncbi:MAG: hypothetical protein WCK84_11225 [Bacteroidota bacterium]
MRKLIIFCIALLFSCINSTLGQDTAEILKKEKKDQTKLFNDIYISYGTGTVFYFIDTDGLKANTLSGTFLIGFSRSITKVIAVGFQLSYTKIGRSGQTYDYLLYPPITSTTEMTDNLWQGIACVRFRYLNTPSFCMYSGIGMGVTMDYYNKTNQSVTSKGQKLLPAGQLTLLGFRVGRAFSFFGEFGIGTNSILNAGVSYKFSD